MSNLTQEDTIFSKIIRKEIPSYKVYEDELVYAFLDISQVTKGHTLVVPKQATTNILTADSETASAVFARVPKIARAIQEAFPDVKGMNVLSNAEEIASQSVFHWHVHLIPRYHKNNDGFGLKWQEHGSDYSASELADIAQTINQTIK